MVGPVIRVFILGLVCFLPVVSSGTNTLVLSEVHLVGTDQLTVGDVVRGLNLKLGEPTTRQTLVGACADFKKLRLFRSTHCRPTIHGHSIALDIDVEGEGMRVVFDNFVWTTRAELLARLKQEIPLFKPGLPESSGLTSDILRVLQQVLDERGIKGSARYDDRFWTNRGMNVFYVQGISTPVASFQIEGQDAPSPEELAKWSQFYTKEDFSAARLNWVVDFVKRDLYKPRGYLRPVVSEPVVQFLGKQDGTYPVRVILPISSGDLYTFDSVKFEGLAKEHAASLLSKWKLRPGDPYDTAYVNTFISNEILSAPWARHSKAESDDALSCVNTDEGTKKVFLTVMVELPKKAHPSTDDECNAVIKALTLGRRE
jgi:outer membrane protein assembly factor BamA